MDETTTASPRSTHQSVAGTGTASRRRRPLRRARLVTAAVAVGALALLAAACAPPPGTPNGDALSAMNQDRAAAGVGPLAWDGQLGDLAQSRANDIAATGVLQHADLAGWLRSGSMPGWTSLGENLLVAGDGTTGWAAEDLWMASPPHQANMLNPGFTQVGIGMTRDAAGRVWYVALFGAR